MAIKQFAIHTVWDAGAVRPLTPMFLALVDELAGVLPADVLPIFGSVKAYRNMEALACQIADGKPAGVLQCASVLQLGVGVVSPVADSSDFGKFDQVVTAQFHVGFNELIKKTNVDAINDFINKYEEINVAIAKWSFGSEKMKFLASNVKDEAWAKESRSVELFVTGAVATARVLKDLAAFPSMPWMMPAEVEQLKTAVASTELIVERGAHGARILGAMIICNGLLLQSLKDGHKKYVIDRLGVAWDSLPRSLIERVNDFFGGRAPAPPPAGAAADAPSASAGGDNAKVVSPPAPIEVEASGKPPKKKMRLGALLKTVSVSSQ